MSSDGVGAMSEENKSALVPRLRFPEFQDSEEWKAKSLDSVCNVLQGYGFPESLQGRTEGRYSFCKVSDISRAVAENGGLLAKAANYVGDSDLLELRAKLIPIGTTVFAKIGEALRLNRRAFVQHECLIDNNAVGLKGVEGIADDYFIHLLSQLIDLNEHCGGAVPSVNKSTLEAIKVIVPELDEQQKIADCLSSLDELITAETQKLDALKTHKKGLMQQLFPREGETVPRLRFPEFREAGEWKVQALGEAATFYNGRAYAKEELLEAGKYKVIRVGNFFTSDKWYFSNLELDDSKYCDDGDLLYAWSASFGPRIWRGGKSIYHYHIWKVVENSGISRQFLFIALDIETERMKARSANGIGMFHITKGTIESWMSVFPPFVEQQKIADCLSSLDEIIIAQSQKIAALKIHKKGLMQQLFPALDEVPV